jgi:hypothetical protein
VLAGLTFAEGAAAQQGAFPSHDVRVTVTIAGDGVVNVREDFALTALLESATFELLEDPCSSPGSVSASLDGRRVALETDRASRAPWTIVHSPSGAARSRIELSYDVRLSGSEASVPLLVPAASLERAHDSRGAHVTVEVEFDRRWPGSRVLMPRLEPGSNDSRWEGHFLAMPSVVRIYVPRDAVASCDRHITGTTGGLEWRFETFVTVMALWVPIYLGWFARSGRRSARRQPSDVPD